MYLWRATFSDNMVSYITAPDWTDAATQATVIADKQGSLVVGVMFDLCLHQEGEDAPDCKYQEWN